MDTLIGRKEEINEFQRLINSGRAEFIAVYGRRRIGKTFLVRSIFNNNFAFDATGIIDGTKEEQMSAFVSSMRQIGYKGGVPKNWLEAFFELRNLLEPVAKASNERVVIFIDELPCFETQKSGFLTAFGHFWNSWANWQDNIMLIVCGSATSWMVDNLINNHGGLYDRLTRQIHLKQFSLNETMEYFESKNYGFSKLMVMQIYMAFGGVPYYLRYFNKGESFAQAIDRLFFNGGILKNEFNQMFASLFHQPETYIEVLKALSKTKSGITRQEINKGLNKYDNGHLSKILEDLEKCDFIRKFYTIGKNNKIKSSSCYYQLMDFYTIFYFTFSESTNTPSTYWQDNIGTPKINTWNGLAFERLVFSHIDNIKKALGIDRISCEYYSWRSKDPGENVQIDLILERADNVTNICEIKYSSAEYTLNKDEYMKIMHRTGTFQRETGTKSAIWPTIITPFGLSRNEYYFSLPAMIKAEDWI